MNMDLPDTVQNITATLNFDEICRLCLKKVSNMSRIFTFPIPTKIMSLVSVEIFEGDGLPALICQQCYREIDRSFKFKLLCQSSDATLRQYVSRNTSISVESKSLFTNTPSAEVLPYEADQVVEDINCAKHLLEYRTIHPHPRQETTMENEDMVIVCNVESLEDRTVPVSVQHPTAQHPTNVNRTLDKESVDQTNTIKRTFIPSLPRIIKIMRPKQAYAGRPTDSFAPRSRLKLFNCSICSKSFTKRDNLKKHQVMHIGEKPFLCDECGKSFSQKNELNVHMRYHSGVRPYSCSVCNKTFVCVSAQKIHENHHNGVKPFLCIVCGKTFLRKSGLNNHERVHTQEKPYSCNVCIKTFRTLTNLKTHEKRHTGINEFCCRTCKKSFFTKAGLERHELVHTGHKQFLCEICSCAFFTKSEISRHMRYHRGEKRFNCNQCSKSFVENQHLVVHKRIHSGERPYLCQLCKKSFYTKSKLNRHMRTHDGNQS